MVPTVPSAQSHIDSTAFENAVSLIVTNIVQKLQQFEWKYSHWILGIFSHSKVFYSSSQMFNVR